MSDVTLRNLSTGEIVTLPAGTAEEYLATGDWAVYTGYTVYTTGTAPFLDYWWVLLLLVAAVYLWSKRK
jgi:hypothetical protein